MSQEYLDYLKIQAARTSPTGFYDLVLTTELQSSELVVVSAILAHAGFGNASITLKKGEKANFWRIDANWIGSDTAAVQRYHYLIWDSLVGKQGQNLVSGFQAGVYTLSLVVLPPYRVDLTTKFERGRWSISYGENHTYVKLPPTLQ